MVQQTIVIMNQHGIVTSIMILIRLIIVIIICVYQALDSKQWDDIMIYIYI